MLGAWVSRRLSRSWQAAGNVDVAPTPVVVDKIKGDDEQRARDLRSAAIYVRQMGPLAGTPGEAYLRIERKIDTAVISDVMNSTAAIGWHDEVFFRQENHRLDGRRIGAIIAVMTDALTGAPTGAISRTYIHEGQKIGKAKGLAGSGVVLLTPDEDVLGGLHIAEGLETGLDRMAKGARPMWSTARPASWRNWPSSPASRQSRFSPTMTRIAPVRRLLARRRLDGWRPGARLWWSCRMSWAISTTSPCGARCEPEL
jgi:hypothetical protein